MKSKMDLGELEKERERLNELMEETGRAMVSIKFALEPYWYAKGEIEHQVLRTHGRTSNNTLVFVPEGAAARVPLFEQLMELAIEWGPVKKDYAAIKSRLSGYERAVKRIVLDIKRARKDQA